MSRKMLRFLLSACFPAILHISMAAQQKGGGGAAQAGQTGQAAQGGAAGGAGLQGLSFTPNQWPYMDLPNPRDPDVSFDHQSRVVVCYRLAKGNSATQPFLLEPIALNDVPYSGFERPCGEKSEGPLAGGDLEGEQQCKYKKADDDPHWTPCTEFQNNTPALKANQILVVGIDISDLGEAGPDTGLELTGPNQNQLKLFNINVTNQQGSPLNPAPVRASFPSASAGGGVSGQAPSIGIPKIVDTNGGDSEWTYIGNKAPSGGGPIPWLRDHAYIKGDIVSDATGTDFYRLNFKKPPAKNDCPTANLPPGTKKYYCSGEKPNDPFPVEQTADRIIDGGVVWQEMSAPSTNTISNSFIWERNHDYLAKGVVVCVLRGKNDRVSEATNKFYFFKFDDEKKCSSKERSLDKAKDEHLHYYFAVKGGRSGEIPQDPFSVDYLPRVIYLPWPYLLPGDAVPTFNVNLVYTPPTPGAPWQGNTFYPAGSVVTPGTSNGHYYTALTGGFSDLEPREPDFPASDPYNDSIHDGSLYWLDSGTSAPNIPSSPGAGSSSGAGGPGAQGSTSGGSQGSGSGQASKPMLWMPLTHFSLGDTVIRPESGHYFAVVKSEGGLSGAIPTNASGGQPRKDPFPPQAPAASSYVDGQLEWTEASSACTQCTAWQANHVYSVVQGTDPTTHAPVDNQALIRGATYLMTSSMSPSGKSGGNPAATLAPKAPFIGRTDATTPVTDNQVEWRYLPSGTSSQAWQAGSAYSIGQVVCDDANNLNANNCAAHSFVVDRVLAGTSGLSDPSAQPIANPPVTVQDGDLIWTPVSAPAAPVKPWAALKPFSMGDIVQADNRLYYKVIRFTGGVSGNDEKAFQITRSCTVVDPVIKIKDNSAEWQDLGTLRPRTPLSCLDEPYDAPSKLGTLTKFKNWEFVHSHGATKNTVIFEPGEEGGRYYKFVTDGLTGAISPFLNVTPPALITWQDSGSTAPSSVASGQPVDQTVALINLTLPQTHNLARFNISAGAGVSLFNRPPTFGWVLPTNQGVNLPKNSAPGPNGQGYYLPASEIDIGAPPTPIPTTVSTTGAGAGAVAVEPQSGCTFGTTLLTDTSTGAPSKNAPVYPVYECPMKTGTGTRPVDAVLVLTAYLLPVDEEVPWQFEFWKPGAWRGWVPAPSFGMSLTSPTSNFYIGGSNEIFVRNLQVFYGLSVLSQQSRLSAPGLQPLWGGQSTAPTPAIISANQYGMFIGATFNLSNFVQSLIGGGAK
jgi:hypothetical protein